MKKIDKSQYIWAEKYRPQLIEDTILPDDIRSTFKDYITKERFPHLLLTSTNPGLGKTSLTNAIIKELDADVLWLNGSQNRGIDTFRTKTKEFVTSVSVDDSPKIVVIDECLEESQKIQLGTLDNIVNTKLKDMTKGIIYDCVSMNKETQKLENDTCEIISSKTVEVFEVETTDGRTLEITGDHPFLIRDKDGKTISKTINQGLNEDDELIDSFECLTEYNQESTVPVTVRFSKEHVDILNKSDINLEHLLRGFLDTIIQTQLEQDNGDKNDKRK